MISLRTSKLTSSRLEVHLAVLPTSVFLCVFMALLVCFSVELHMLLFCYVGCCLSLYPLSAQVSGCHVESSSSLWVASLVYFNTPKHFNAHCGIDVVRLWVSPSSRSGVFLRFQPPVIFRRCLVVGTSSLVLHDYLYAGAQSGIDAVSQLPVLIISLWFNFKFVLYILDISERL